MVNTLANVLGWLFGQTPKQPPAKKKNSWLKTMLKSHQVASNTLITSCGRCCRWRLAEHVADGMAMAAMQPATRRRCSAGG
jgi:uncharacterized cysteine cluster protein YcgN (CxxCxxCC family)